MKKPSLNEAQALHKESNFKRYQGPKLKGTRTILFREEEGFPDALMLIPEPPEALYVIGNILALSEGLAIIGARKATPYGLSCARRFASRAAMRGLSIISGGALGCDSAAHKAALEVGGSTVVFLGGGCDELYPAKNYELFQEIVDKGGAIVSEYPWEFPPLKYTFRARNRLIAGLARATLIVEAGLPSGTFSTADEALAANKEVLVVPGSISSNASRGSNRLIYQGATPVVDEESFDDILFSLFGFLRQESFVEKQKLGSRESYGDALLQALCAQAMTLEEMLAALSKEGIAPEKQVEVLMTRLVDLQRKGEVMRYPDGRYGSCV